MTSKQLLEVASALEISRLQLETAWNDHGDVMDVDVKGAITDGLAAVARGLRILDPFIGYAVRAERRL
jgi:hypothetical protein